MELYKGTVFYTCTWGSNSNNTMGYSGYYCDRAERCGMRVRVCSRSSKLRVAYLELRTVCAAPGYRKISPLTRLGQLARNNTLQSLLNTECSSHFTCCSWHS